MPFINRRYPAQKGKHMAQGQEELEATSAPTAEELKQEDEVLQETPAEQLRSSIVEKYGLNDDDEHKEFIDNLTADFLEQRKALGKAIKQKRTYREAVNKLKPAERPQEAAQQQQQQQQQPPDVDAIVNKRLEQRDLEGLDMPDNLKTEVQKLAQVQGISILQAARDPYILHKLEEHKREVATDAAAVTRTTRKGSQVKFDKKNPPKVDMSTEEGRKTWDEYKDWLVTQSS